MRIRGNRESYADRCTIPVHIDLSIPSSRTIIKLICEWRLNNLECGLYRIVAKSGGELKKVWTSVGPDGVKIERPIKALPGQSSMDLVVNILPKQTETTFYICAEYDVTRTSAIRAEVSMEEFFIFDSKVLSTV
jgi:hypothetical protein